MKIKGTTKCEFHWHYTDGVMQGACITFNHVIDSFIEKIDSSIKNTGEIEREYTKNLFIDGKHYNNHATVKIKLKVSLRNYPDRVWFNKKYEINEQCTVEQIYNVIADITEFYAYELDTDADNIKISVMQFEIVEKNKNNGGNDYEKGIKYKLK